MTRNMHYLIIIKQSVKPNTHMPLNILGLAITDDLSHEEILEQVTKEYPNHKIDLKVTSAAHWATLADRGYVTHRFTAASAKSVRQKQESRTQPKGEKMPSVPVKVKHKEGQEVLLSVNQTDVENTQGFTIPGIADIDIVDNEGNFTRFFVSAGVKNGRVFVEVSTNIGDKSTRKQVFGKKKKIN